MHIVHLEDDGPLCELLKVAITAYEPNVDLKQFANSHEAIAYIETNLNKIDMFILDIRVIGSLTGIDVARRVRELGCDKLIVVTSAYRKPEQIILKTLRIEWMPKPWHIFEMPEKLYKMSRNQRMN